MSETVMGGASSNDTVALADVPKFERRRILSGMRWGVWLSLLTTPFSIATTVLLAHFGPEVVGKYGLLLVYVSASSSLLYFGGDAVTIHFAPKMDRSARMSFLLTYLLIILATLVPWLAAAALWPQGLRFLFGTQDSLSFQLLVIYLAPICIARMMVLAALTSVLEIRWSQLLNRIVTIGTFIAYFVICTLFAPFFRGHSAAVIWGVYLGLIALSLAVGVFRLTQIDSWRHGLSCLRLNLPHGFWPYTIAIEQVSAVGFFQSRLDLLLVLNFGGLAMLGKYTALLTFAMAPVMVNRWFLDALLPALSTLLAKREVDAASQVFATNLRLLFALQCVVACIGCALITPALHLLGPTYVQEKSAFTVFFLLYSLSSVGSSGGTLLSSVGKQQQAVWVGLVQLALLSAVFLELWPQMQLMGAVVASGGAAVVAQVSLLAVARRNGGLVFSIWRDYAVFGSAAALMASVTLLADPAVPASLAVGCVTVLLYLLLSRYSVAELSTLYHCLVPSRSRIDGTVPSM